MNKFSSTLVTEMPIFYKNFISQNGFVPKIFTLVNEECDQYVFYLDNLDLERRTEEDFYQYILKNHSAIAYSRGFLAALESGNQQIYIVVIGRDDPSGIQLVAPISRDKNGSIEGIGRFKIDSVPREKLFHGQWFISDKFSTDRVGELSTLWTNVKSNAMRRVMPINKGGNHFDSPSFV